MSVFRSACRRRLGLLAAWSLSACTPAPRPTILEEVDRARQAPAAKESSVLAPQAYLEADKLARDAEQRNQDGDRAGAEILGEQALAAYAHASVLARLAKADTRLSLATSRVEKTRREFAELEAEQHAVATEADDVEARVRVARDAIPLGESEPSTPDRERARFQAAKSLVAEARLLCVATQMLGENSPAVAEAFKSLDGLDVELAKRPLHPPIDAAVRVRSACLTELTRARRPATTAAPEAGAADALLDELGKAGFGPTRDDRGVAVVLRDVFQGNELATAGRDRLATLGQVARAHPTFPVLAVLHDAHPAAARDAARGDALASALKAAGAGSVEVRAAGDALPVAPPQRADAARRNERVEIVFVTRAQ